MSLAALGATGAPRARAQAGLALTWRHTGDIGALALVEATLHGRPWRAMVDTGATSAIVSTDLARELALERVDRVRVATLGGVQQAERVRVTDLRLAGAATPAVTALVLDLPALLGPALEGVDGLIGMSSLRGQHCVFDFARQRLQVGADAPAQGLPLRFEAGLPVIELRLGARDPAPFLFDTGNAGALVVFEHHARRLLAGAPPLPPFAVRELGGTVNAQLALLERVDGPGFVAHDVPAAFESGTRARRGGHFDRLAGSVGGALFRSARVTLDAREPGAWRVEPSALPPLPGGFGLALDGQRPPRIAAVIDASPAARAGLAPGQRLLALQGRSARDLAAHEVWQLLDGVDSAAFDFARADETPLRATLARERFLPQLA